MSTERAQYPQKVNTYKIKPITFPPKVNLLLHPSSWNNGLPNIHSHTLPLFTLFCNQNYLQGKRKILRGYSLKCSHLEITAITTDPAICSDTPGR